MSTAKQKQPETARLVSAPDFQRRYGYSSRSINHAAKAGNAPEVAELRHSKGGKTVRMYRLVDLLGWAITRPAKSANKPLMEKHLNALESGMDIADTPQGKPSAKGTYASEMLERVLGVKIPPEALVGADSLVSIAKAVGEVHKSDAAQMRVMQDMGRLVDVKEIEELARIFFGDWVGELEDLPSRAPELARDLDMPESQARAMLEWERTRLLAVLASTGGRMDKEAVEFMRQRRKEGRK